MLSALIFLMGDEKRMARTRYKEPSSRGEYNSKRISNYTLLSGSCTYILASTYLAYSKTKQVNYSATTFYPLRYVPFIFTLFDALYARPMEIQFFSLRYLATRCLLFGLGLYPIWKTDASKIFFYFAIFLSLNRNKSAMRNGRLVSRK